MADGDRGGGEGGWDHAIPEVYDGRPLNPMPLAMALPSSYAPFNVMGRPALWHNAGEIGTKPAHPHPHRHSQPHPHAHAVWQAGPPTAPVAVAIPPVYFTNPPPMPPMAFPAASIKAEIPPPVTVRPAGAGVMALPPQTLHANHPHTNFPSGMNEARVSAASALVPILSSSAGEQNVVEKAEPERKQRHLSTITNKKRVVSPIAPSTSPANLLSLDPPIAFTEPLSVPEGIPRDPVPQAARGEGWPYAPQGWPNPDDKWGWRVGKRASPSSLWIDRYITVPASLTKGKRIAEFASKKALVEFLRQTFPEMKDPDSILKAFDWKVPAPKNFEAPEKPEKRGPTVKRNKPASMDGEEDEHKAKKQCQANNPHCLLTKAKGSEVDALGRLVCQICCSEPNFCRECKCILCCKFFAPDADDFSIIRCLNSPTSGQGICAHAAHLKCALDSQLAGVSKKIGLDMEYICRRCDRKTDLIETVSRLVDFMSKTATKSKVESSLQLVSRIVQDPEDEADTSEKIQATLIGVLKKVQEGADIVETCKELSEQLHERRSGQGVHDSEVSHQVPNWSRAIELKCEWECSLRPSETSLDKRVPQSKSVGSSDVRIDSVIVSQGVCEADGVATTSGTRAEPDLDMEKELPSTLLQDSPKQDNHVLSTTLSHNPSELPLASLLDQSVCKPPTLSIEEHIRQCEAMTNRVKGAGQLNNSHSTYSVSLPGTIEGVLNPGSNPPGGSLTVESHENQVVVPVAETSRNSGPPCGEELVTTIPSSSRARSPSLFNSQDADEDHVADTELIEACEQDDEVEEACIHNVCGSSKIIEGAKRAIKGSNKTIEVRMGPDIYISGRLLRYEPPFHHLLNLWQPPPNYYLPTTTGGDDTASIKIIEVSKSSRIKPATSSSGAKDPSLANSQDAEGDGVVEATQIIEGPTPEPPTGPSFDPALETTQTAGLQEANHFEEQISVALEKLKRAQGAEYARAEESLNAQKEIVIEQYRQFVNVFGKFAKKPNLELFLHQLQKNQRDKPRAEFDRAMNRLITQYGKAQEAQRIFESMLAISNGFGPASKEFLREFFKWPPSDITDA